MLKGTYQTQQLRLYVICFSVLLPSCFIDGPKIVEDAGEANKSPNEVDSEIDSKGESDCEADGDTDTETNSYTDTTFDSNSEESCTGCLIDGVCFSNGMVNPDNSCLICAIKSSKTSWSYNNGIACNDGLFCTENDKCVDGICSGASKNCADNIECNGSEVCDEELNQCLDGTSKCNADEFCDVANDSCVSGCNGCTINGSCYEDGAVFASNSCLVCNVSVSTTDWTNDIDASCNDENRCTNNDHCNAAGVCEGTSVQCDDGVACTNDSCENGQCIAEVKPSYCMIQGLCFSHGENNPENTCQYCDASLKKDEWTNWSKAMVCDDGFWCNGNDFCDGQGHCGEHQFPTGNRCESMEGSCVRDDCDEAEDSCYLSSDTYCDESHINQCSDVDTCGARVERMTTLTYCSGDSENCSGQSISGTFQTIEQCGNDEICDESTYSCKPSFKCNCTSHGDWYDSETGLCWQKSPNSLEKDWQGAYNYCEDLELGGANDWRLPNVEELITLLRGCVNGQETTATMKSPCSLSPDDCVRNNSCDSWVNCDYCDVLQGPDSDPSGCYWVSALDGPCYDYWSSTLSVYPDFAWLVMFRRGDLVYAAMLNYQHRYARCVRSE